jgi:hypothetical protein
MNDLEKQTLRLIGEDPEAPDIYTDDSEGLADIRESLNDCIEEIAMLTGAVKRTYTIVLRTSQAFYRFAFSRDQFARITDVWLPVYRRRLEQTDIYRLNRFNPRWMQNIGTPQSYFPIGNDSVGFWPAPGGDDMTVEITAVVIPERYKEEVDRIKMREAWQDVAVHYGCGEYFAMRGDVKHAQYDLQHYSEFLNSFIGYPIAGDARPMLKTKKEPWPRSTE